jgi:hypothetical protein
LPEGHDDVAFCPLNRKLKYNYLCDLCVSSEAGGDNITDIDMLEYEVNETQ